MYIISVRKVIVLIIYLLDKDIIYLLKYFPIKLKFSLKVVIMNL